MKPGFHRPERDLSFRGDFALAHPFKESQIDHFFLSVGQFLHRPFKELGQVMHFDLVRVGRYFEGQRIIGVGFQAFGGAPVNRLVR